MIFGNLESVLEGDKSLYDVYQEQINEEYKQPSKFSDVLKTLSHYGMSYSKEVYNNMHAIPANKQIAAAIDPTMQQSIYGTASSLWKLKPDEEKPFREKTLEQKRVVLRKIATEPEIEDILDIMANECIVYDSDYTYICQPFIDNAVIQMFNEESASTIRSAVDAAFYKMYNLVGWKLNAWNTFKKYLIDGVLAYEIVYDDIENPKTILGIVELDPATLTKGIENGVEIWIQFKGIIGRERKLLDSQIIYIKYEDSGVIDRLSYVERLTRPFNIYRIIEQAQIIWTVTQSSFKTMFTIPVGQMNRAKGAQTLNSAMNRYKEDISFNNETGELLINGRTNMPFNKEYWMPQNELGKPEIETIVDGGPSLADSEQLRFYLSKLYKISKIPESRFDKEAQSTWFGADPTQQLRDEINFSRFVERIRNNYAEILLKPLRISVALSLPEIKNDKRILDAISLQFNSYNQFEELMDIEIKSKRIEFIANMSQSLVVTDAEGNEVPYFSMKFLIMKYLKMSDADLELNEKYKFEEKVAAGKMEDDVEDEVGDDTEESDDLMDTGSEEKPEEKDTEPDENNNIDSEMLGDVQPESTETTQA